MVSVRAGAEDAPLIPYILWQEGLLRTRAWRTPELTASTEALFALLYLTFSHWGTGKAASESLCIHDSKCLEKHQHNSSPSTQNTELAKLPTKLRLEEKGAKLQGISEKCDKQISSMAGRPGTDIRPGREG